MLKLCVNKPLGYTQSKCQGGLLGTLGLIYTKRQRQCCDDVWDSVLIENNRVAPELVATHCQVSPLISMRTELLVSWQSCRSVDAEASCKWVLKVCLHIMCF